MVDGDGKPLVVWRGDSEPVDAYDRAKVRDGGIFTTPDREGANGYARSGQARPMYVSAKKVLDLRDPYSPENRAFLKDYKREFSDWEDRQTGEITSPEDHLDRGDLFDYEGNWSGQRWRGLFNLAEHKGYDAVWANDTIDGQIKPSLVVFDPKNLKSADANRGTFDPHDPHSSTNPSRARGEWRADGLFRLSKLVRGVEGGGRGRETVSGLSLIARPYRIHDVPYSRERHWHAFRDAGAGPRSRSILAHSSRNKASCARACISGLPKY